MKHSDRQPDNTFSRRKTLILLRAIGAVTLVTALDRTATSALAAPHELAQAPSSKPGDTLPTCVVTPAQIEGPYFVDERLNRSDIRTDPSDGSVKPGMPLQLTLRVFQISNAACTPLANAIVDIWHCDAQGIYSDVSDPSFNTVGKEFLRGYQTTDENGTVQFTTIYPGWYPGRAVHIHFKVRTTIASNQHYEFTSQLYFDDAITDRIHAQVPYTGQGQRDRRNAKDWIYRNGGEQLLLPLTDTDSGYTTTFDIGLEMV